VDVEWQGSLPLVDQPAGFTKGVIQPEKGSVRILNAQDNVTFSVKVSYIAFSGLNLKIMPLHGRVPL
jgi:hypothetical protein